MAAVKPALLFVKTEQLWDHPGSRRGRSGAPGNAHVSALEQVKKMYEKVMVSKLT